MNGRSVLGGLLNLLRSISRGLFFLLCVCALEFWLCMRLFRKFQINDLEMVRNGTFCRGMRDLNSRSMSGNDDWFGFPESELCSRVVSFRPSSLPF